MANIQLGSVLAVAANVEAPRIRAPAPVAGETLRPAARGNSAPAAAPPPVPQAAESSAVREALEDAFGRIRAFLGASSAALEFTVDDTSGRTIVRVMDGETKEVIRQIPSDEVLAIARALDRLQGLFLRQQA